MTQILELPYKGFIEVIIMMIFEVNMNTLKWEKSEILIREIETIKQKQMEILRQTKKSEI